MSSSSVIPALRVLLVDDDDTVRRLAARILRMSGFEVCECASGDEAVAAADGETDFDVLVTDAIMPGMSGIEVARQVCLTDPDLPVVLMSGYAADDLGGALRQGAARNFLQKPFRPAELTAITIAAARSRGAVAA